MGIEPATFQLQDKAPANWATQAKALGFLFVF